MAIDPSYQELRNEAWQTIERLLAGESVTPQNVLHFGMFFAWSDTADTFGKRLEPLRQALVQQRAYERDHWPFEGGETGESITYHIASLYCWTPEFVLTLPEVRRNERLQELWKTLSIAGDIIRRYETATGDLVGEYTAQEAQEEG